MGKAKRFNPYDESVSEKRKTAENFGELRQKLSGIGSSFRSPPLEPPIANPLPTTSPCPAICTEHNLGSVTGLVEVDWRIASFFRAVLTGDTTFNFTNTPKTPKWQDICLEVQQDGTGGHTATFQQSMDNSFVPKAITGANRYTSWQIYTYQEPSGTDVFQAFEKTGSFGPSVPGGGGDFQGFSGYIHAKLSADQTSPSINQHIEFDTAINNDNIAVSSGTGQAKGIFTGLRPSHLYECTAYLAALGSGNTLDFAAQWYDRTNAALIGTEGELVAITGATNKGSQFVAKAFFTPVSMNDSLEVRITGATAVTSITNGSTSTEATCMATIKDCGLTEAIINQPEPPEGELDIREMVHTIVDAPNSASNRFGAWGYFIGNTPSQSDTFTAMKKFVIKHIMIYVNVIGAIDREIALQINNVDVAALTFTLSASTTGLVVDEIKNVVVEQGDIVEWRTSGGTANTEKVQITCNVWWL